RPAAVCSYLQMYSRFFVPAPLILQASSHASLSRSLSGFFLGRGEIFHNSLIYSCFFKGNALQNRRLCLLGCGTSVDLYHQPLKTEKRRAAMLRSVKSLQCSFQGRLRKKSADLSCQRRHHALLHNRHHGLCQTFLQLQDYISHESFRDDNVYVSLRDIPCLNAAHKVDARTFLQKRVSLFHQRVALGFLRTDVY